MRWTYVGPKPARCTAFGLIEVEVAGVQLRELDHRIRPPADLSWAVRGSAGRVAGDDQCVSDSPALRGLPDRSESASRRPAAGVVVGPVRVLSPWVTTVVAVPAMAVVVLVLVLLPGTASLGICTDRHRSGVVNDRQVLTRRRSSRVAPRGGVLSAYQRDGIPRSYEDDHVSRACDRDTEQTSVCLYTLVVPGCVEQSRTMFTLGDDDGVKLLSFGLVHTHQADRHCILLRRFQRLVGQHTLNSRSSVDVGCLAVVVSTGQCISLRRPVLVQAPLRVF